MRDTKCLLVQLMKIWQTNGMILNASEQKGITKEDLIDAGFMPGTLTGGKDGTASEMIDYLLKAKPKIDPNGDPIEKFDDEGIGEDIPF